MKFKGIELKDNTEAELFIAIEIVNINNEEELKKYGKKLMTMETQSKLQGKKIMFCGIYMID